MAAAYSVRRRRDAPEALRAHHGRPRESVGSDAFSQRSNSRNSASGRPRLMTTFWIVLPRFSTDERRQHVEDHRERPAQDLQQETKAPDRATTTSGDPPEAREPAVAVPRLEVAGQREDAGDDQQEADDARKEARPQAPGRGQEAQVGKRPIGVEHRQAENGCGERQSHVTLVRRAVRGCAHGPGGAPAGADQSIAPCSRRISSNVPLVSARKVRKSSP